MLAKTLILASVASLAVAQTATTSASSSSSTCAGQVILDSCLGTIQASVNACATNDYSCLCSAYNNMVGCYASSGCSSDPKIGTYQSLREQNCNAASVYGSTTTLGTAPATSATAASTTSGEASATSGFASGTRSSSSTASADANAAANIKVGGGLIALVAAGVAAFL